MEGGVDTFVAITGPVVALAAVIIAFWQVRRTILATGQTNSLPVVTNLFNEFRSSEFQHHIESCSRWCLGILVAHRLIPEEVVIDATANSAARTWSVLEPFIRAERQRRQEANKGTTVSSGFVTHYEHLVALMSVDDEPADRAIHLRLDLRTMPGNSPTQRREAT
jgi:hypothetical protein